MTVSFDATLWRDRLAADIAERVLAAEAATTRPTHLLSPAEVRAGFEAGKRPLERKPTALNIRDITVDTPAADLPARVYTPTQGATAPFAAMVYFHGGAFTNGDLDSHDAMCCVLAQELPCVVIAIDYRKMPKHHFPAAYDDAVASLKWVKAHAAELNIDPERIGSGGDSAGANLAVAAAMALRGEQNLKALWLAYPFLGHDFETPSYKDNAAAPLLTTARCVRIMQDYFGNTDLSGADWRIAPLLTTDFANMPASVSIGAELDPIYSDAVIYTERMNASGSKAVMLEAKGMPHAFVRFVESSDSVRKIIDESIDAVRPMLLG